MRPEDFDFIALLLRTRSGLVLNRDKMYLLESRLMPLARRKGYKGIDDLIVQVRRRNLPLEKEIVDAMTTNESFFFRDIRPFEHFRKTVLPNLIRTRGAKKSFRIWCAAASSGQEPYSLAIILKEEAKQLAGWRTEILATDISQDILAKARAGAYTQFEVQRGMPADLLIRYFEKKGDNWEISQQIQSMVQFREWNLLDDFRPLGMFDVVFCRNVLLYFDHATKSDVLDRVARLMTDDGCLYLGGAETVIGVSSLFRPVPQVSSAYQLTRNPAVTPLGLTVGTDRPPPTIFSRSAAAPGSGNNATKTLSGASFRKPVVRAPLIRPQPPKDRSGR